MRQLLTPRQAAKEIGSNLEQVYVWMRRLDDPLPSVSVGASGRHRRVVAEQIGPWLAREAERDRSAKPPAP